jgi:hypothetical protein
MSHRATIEAYYRAFRDRDQHVLRSILTEDFLHVSSFGVWRDRDAMIEAIWPAIGGCWAGQLEIFGTHPRYMVRYQHECLSTLHHRNTRVAEFIRFYGSRIAEIEVYIGCDGAGDEVA